VPPATQPPPANDLVLQNEIPEDDVQQQKYITIETPNAPPVHDPGQQEVVNAEELIPPENHRPRQSRQPPDRLAKPM
jgi:hypothetical protein